MHRLIRPTFIKRARDNDGGGAGIQRARMKLENENCRRQGGMSREKAGQPKCHSSALSQQDENSSEIVDICELHTKKCRTRSMLRKTRRARAESPDGTPVQRVERVKKGWGDVRASTGKRGTTTHGLHHMEMPAPQNLSHRNMQERSPKIPHRDNRKNEERKDSPAKQLPTSTAVCGPGGREQRSR
jgi:hypothetical protein